MIDCITQSNAKDMFLKFKRIECNLNNFCTSLNRNLIGDIVCHKAEVVIDI